MHSVTRYLACAHPFLLLPSGESSQSGQQSEGDHHFDKVVYKVAHEASGGQEQGGRFDEEPFMPEQPYR